MRAAHTGAATSQDAELSQLGIVRVQTEHFLWNGYRYTNLSDAIAAARRGRK